MAEELEQRSTPAEATAGAAAPEKIQLKQGVTAEAVAADGLPDSTEADFAYIPHRGSRHAAVKEYNRTLEEFRQTGSIEDREWGDFAHLTNPLTLRAHVFNAHCEASLAVDRWLDERAKAAPVPEIGANLDDDEEDYDDEEDEFDEAEEAEDELGPEPAGAFADALDDAKTRLDALKGRAALADQPLPVPPMPLPQIGKTAGLLRGISFEPDAPSRNARFEPPVPQLEVAPPPEQLSASDDQTEALLNAMIGECHFLMRAVAFPSMCHAGVADDRLRWVSKAIELAETGATVAKAVARLRHGPGVKETRHTTTIVQNRLAAMAEGGGG